MPWIIKNGCACDTPSRTGRKLIYFHLLPPPVRYTLPYREETISAYETGLRLPIHPPVQGGNLFNIHFYVCTIDTPSRTGRKLIFKTGRGKRHRYTLPYREETFARVFQHAVNTIHPPVQGGNTLVSKKWLSRCDTPSRTGRKQQLSFVVIVKSRYTLPYREETLSVYAGFSHLKHLVVQFAQIVFFHY